MTSTLMRSPPLNLFSPFELQRWYDNVKEMAETTFHRSMIQFTTAATQTVGKGKGKQPDRKHKATQAPETRTRAMQTIAKGEGKGKQTQDTQTDEPARKVRKTTGAQTIHVSCLLGRTWCRQAGEASRPSSSTQTTDEAASKTPGGDLPLEERTGAAVEKLRRPRL